jgi:hypothetical protein
VQGLPSGINTLYCGSSVFLYSVCGFFIVYSAKRTASTTPFYIPPGIPRYTRRYTPLYRRFPYPVQDFPASRRQPVLYDPYQKQPPVRYRLEK